jgi:hypothetical protein
MNSPWTDFLYARPSFLEGMARVMDIGGTLNFYNDSESTVEADAKALMADWYAIGDDLKRAVEIAAAELAPLRLA